MVETRQCSQCGADFAARSGVTACPACLLELGLHHWAGEETEEPGGAESNGKASPRFQPPKPHELATRFPHLEILDLIGQGGMGAVYKARQVRLDRLVALKIIVPESAQEPGFAQRFEREARALAKLNHPHVVTVYDFGVADGIFYLIMEYVDGTNLRQLIHSGELRPESAMAMVPQICDALQFAHDQGIVHRDIKPENILVDRQGNVKIADFGLAKLVDRAPQYQSLTKTGQVVGTPHYMAPEQLERPLEVDHRADIYSLGVVLYEMLTGELPLGRFNRPSQRVRIDVRLDRVVLRALEKEPALRYQHVSEISGEVKSLSGSGRAPLGGIHAQPEHVVAAFFVNLFVIGATIPLVWFAIWWTESPWTLLGFCLAWVFLGASIEDDGGPWIWAEIGVCFLAMVGLIAYSVWLTKEPLPIFMLLPAFGAFGFGAAIGEGEKKKRLKAERKQQRAARRS